MNELTVIHGDLKEINGELMMSSKQIADLLGKRHDSLKRSMERLEDQEVITVTPMVEPIPGGGKPLSIYYVNEEHSYIVVAQNCPEFTARLVKEWRRLTEENFELKQTILEMREEIKQLTSAVKPLPAWVGPPQKAKKITRKLMTQENYDIIKGLAQAGLSFQEMAERTGYSEATVRSVKNGAYDWKFGPKEIKQAIVNINQ